MPDWSPHPGSNRGPLPYQGSALPLSYVGRCSVPRESGRDGAGNGVRTRDIQLGRLTLYQLSYSRLAAGPGEGLRDEVVPREGFEPS